MRARLHGDSVTRPAPGGEAFLTLFRLMRACGDGRKPRRAIHNARHTGSKAVPIPDYPGAAPPFNR
jgi:hypothetical protein